MEAEIMKCFLVAAGLLILDKDSIVSYFTVKHPPCNNFGMSQAVFHFLSLRHSLLSFWPPILFEAT